MRVFRVAIGLAVSLSILASPVSAHRVSNWESSSEITQILGSFTRHWTNDAFRTAVSMTWSSTKASNMRHNRSHGDYFTFDSRDTTWNVDAYAQVSSMPNPYFDYDDDNGDDRRDEAEVVSENANFPAANTYYDAFAYFSHSFIRNGSWTWDSDSGTIGFWESLSNTSCPIFCDKYDTAVCCAAVTPTRNYGTWSHFAAPTADGGGDAPLSPEPIQAAPAGRKYSVVVGSDPGRVHLTPDLTAGLDSYRRSAELLATAVANTNRPANGVVTFRRPVSQAVIGRLEAEGLEVTELEGVSAPDGTGLHWSFSVLNELRALGLVMQDMKRLGLSPLGISAAKVVVPNAAVLSRIQANPDVYLVDLSVADYEAAVSGNVTAGMNDVYWALAGWE